MKQTLKYIYQNLIEKTKIAESKFSISIALASAVIVFASSFLTDNNVSINVVAGGCIVFALTSILYAFVALLARNVKIKKKHKTKQVDNLLYFKNIVKFDEFTYVEEIKNKYNFPKSYKPDNFDFDLAREIIAAAKSVNHKFLYFNFSLFFLMMSIVFAVGLVLFVGGI